MLLTRAIGELGATKLSNLEVIMCERDTEKIAGRLDDDATPRVHLVQPRYDGCSCDMV